MSDTINYTVSTGIL